MTFAGIIRRVHLWIGILLGVQVFLWLLSGLVMTWFHISLVRGETNSFQAPPKELAAANYITPGGVIARSNGVTSLELKDFRGRAVYVATLSDGSREMFDAETGKSLSPISKNIALSIAEDDFTIEAEVSSVTLMDNPPHEYRRELPVWRVDFDDKLKTRIYISPSTGEIVSRRNMVWRIFDFFWMLHIMDYDERENFNTWWLQAASLFGTIFAISGLIMVVMRNGRRQIAADLSMLSQLGKGSGRKS